MLPEGVGGWIVAAIVVAAWIGIIALVERHARAKAKSKQPERRGRAK